MIEADPQIRFRPLAMGDLPLMHRWLGEPHVRQWWHDGAGTLAEANAKYAPRIAGAEPTRCFAIEYGGSIISVAHCSDLEPVGGIGALTRY